MSGGLFRPFGGGGNLDSRLLSPSALEYLKRGRYTCVLWNSIPGDWKIPKAGSIVRWRIAARSHGP